MKKTELIKPKTKRKSDVAFFIIVALAIIAIMLYNKTKQIKNIDAEQVAALLLDHHPLSFAKNGIIEENALKGIQEMEYEELKSSLNIKKDFCVYVEDSKGNVLIAKGSSKLSKDGLYCKG